MKQGKFIKTNLSRYFVLESGTLNFYEKMLTTTPYGLNKKGEVKLENVKINLLKNSLVHLAFENKNHEKDVFLDIRDSKEKMEWIAAFKNHIQYNYSKIDNKK
jgi:hypothetical protein